MEDDGYEDNCIQARDAAPLFIFSMDPIDNINGVCICIFSPVSNAFPPVFPMDNHNSSPLAA